MEHPQDKGIKLTLNPSIISTLCFILVVVMGGMTWFEESREQADKAEDQRMDLRVEQSLTTILGDIEDLQEAVEELTKMRHFHTADGEAKRIQDTIDFWN